jgi:acetyl esterase/lipase
VLLHGGFWKAKYSLSNAGTREVAAALVARGWHVADIEYRRVGNDGGGWPGSNHDVLAALGCIREHLAEIVHGSTVPPRVALFGCALRSRNTAHARARAAPRSRAPGRTADVHIVP